MATNLPESKHLASLRDKLREMFQLDQAELDFGIYRIMNAKRDEVERFLDDDLLPQVRDALERYQPAEFTEKAKELEDAIGNAKSLGIDPGTIEKVQQLREELTQSVDVDRLEEEVYSHLTTFFSRYYHGGDLMSLRRYKEGVYALPYEGEEVKLHWANADQYYIKSSESFRSYAIKTARGRVRFDLASAGSERDNVKATAGKERRFILDRDTPLAMDGEDLVIRFHYRPNEDKQNQKNLNAGAVETILSIADDTPPAAEIADWPAWKDALSAKSPTPKNADRTILEKHLTDYTAKNSFDYFIHKNLGRFLRQELDFFIKNEVMFLDDIESDTAPRVEQYLSKIKVLRFIAHKFIDFLAQLEDFQKKMWLKKKFVLETNWLVTLDKVPQDLYSQIAASEPQRKEWVKLFAIDEIKKDLAGAVDYSEPLNIEFLKANPFLVLDTAFFDEAFKDELLASFDDIEEETGGLLVHGENFQALKLLQERFREQVKCIYIDPPYNTKDDDTFPYKDNYKISSWLTLISDRLKLAKDILCEDGLFFFQIGDDESARSKILIDNYFEEFKNTSVVRRGIKNVQAQFKDIDRLNVGHDVIHIAAKSQGLRVPHLKQGLEKEKAGKWDTFWRGTDRETMRYELFGQNPTEGQWRWETNRANTAKVNYEHYLEFEASHKTLDEWYIENIQNNVDLDFVRLNDDDVVQYYVSPQNARLVSDNWLDIPASGSITDFPHEKSLTLLRRIMEWNCNPGDWVLDYFAGSGSTGHAAIRPGKETLPKYRPILIEVGKHFDAILKPRIARFTYASSWRDSKPQDRLGQSFAAKYIRLESYEDCLDNLTLSCTTDQQKLVDEHGRFREDYMLRYMLDVEAKGSVLDVDAFADPFGYKLSVVRDDERRNVSVDLTETFNYLLGLCVKTRERVRDVLEITGTNPEGDSVLILWRNVVNTDNDALDEWFKKRGYNARDIEFDLIYINGDNNIENLRRSDEMWKVNLTEEIFKTLMFNVEDV